MMELNKNQIKTERKTNLAHHARIYWSYLVFLFKVITRHFTNWLIFAVYLLLLLLILVIIPAALDSSPVAYWSNPVIQVSSFIMPIAAIFASCISVDLFRDGIDTGIELIIISKPVSRINYVLSKFSLLLFILLFYGLTSSLIGLLTYAVPKMDHALVGDLIAGLFAGTFINGLFFGSFAILFSLRLGKNSTNMIIILLTLLCNFLTPLSMLFFNPPAKVLSDEGVNLMQQKIQKASNNPENTLDGSSVIFQIPSTFGQTKYVDTKASYEYADTQSFYTKSFYLNVGNMINSLYNLGSLAPYNNAYIGLSPSNTNWSFHEKVDAQQYTHVLLGTSGNNPLLNNVESSPLFEQRYLFLPLPASESWSKFKSIFGVPSYAYLTDSSKNEVTKEPATGELYVRDDQKIDSALTNGILAFNELLKEPNGQFLQQQIVSAINGITDATTIEPNLKKLAITFQQMLTAEMLRKFQTAFENKYFDANNELFAKNVFNAKISLFYGLDALARNQINAYATFASTLNQSPMINAINNPFLTKPETFALVKQLFPLAPAIEQIMSKNKNVNIDNNKLLGGLVLSYIFNNYAGIYFINPKIPNSNNNNPDDIIKQRTSLGIYVLKKEQIGLSYVVTTQPVVDPSIIVLVMIIASLGLFVGISVLYYYQDLA